MDELGKSIPAAEGLVDAEQGNSTKPINEHCLNCGTKLLDTFCHHCGQKDIPKRQTLGELWTNFIASFWSFEGKFFKSTKYLLIRPGFLALEYTEGRRERYFHPARMYVFISFVFFLVYFSIPDKASDKGTSFSVGGDDFASEKPLPNVDSLLTNLPLDSADRAEVDSSRVQLSQTKVGQQNVGFSLSQSDYKSHAQYDSAQLTEPENERDNWFVRKLMYKIIDVRGQYNGDWKKFGEDYKQAFQNNFSKLLFWLLPFFALLLKLLYIRRGYFYSEHLVFTIYTYNFFFLAGSIQMLVDLVPWLGWLAVLIGFWVFFYPMFAMKRMYGQSWGKTILKFMALASLFIILLGIGFTISAFFILMAF